MNTFPFENFNGAYPQMVHKTMQQGDISSPHGTAGVRRTRELHPAIVEVSDPTQHLITSYGRPVNVTFALAEVLWILAGRNDVEFLAPYNSNISNFSDDGQTFNAAYGARLRETFGHDQILDTVRTLEADPDSRRAVMGIWHPGFDRGYIDPQCLLPHQTKDRACNLLSMLLVRDGKLEWTQIQRSNDLIWGTPYNYMQFSHLHRWMAEMLDVAQGKFTHVINSLHVYEDFWEEAQNIEFFNLYPLVDQNRLAYYEQWGRVSDELVDDLLRYEQIAREGKEPVEELDTESPYWFGVVAMFHAHRAYRYGDDTVAAHILTSNCHPVYGLAQMRFYWAMRWGKNPEKYHEVDALVSKQGGLIGNWIRGQKSVPSL